MIPLISSSNSPRINERYISPLNMPKQVRKMILPRPSQKFNQFPSRLSYSLYLLHSEANLAPSRNRSLAKRKGLLAKAKEARGRKTKRRLAFRRKFERRVVLCRIRRENNKSLPSIINQTTKPRRDGPVIIKLVSESEDTDVEESRMRTGAKRAPGQFQ